MTDKMIRFLVAVNDDGGEFPKGKLAVMDATLAQKYIDGGAAEDYPPKTLAPLSPEEQFTPASELPAQGKSDEEIPPASSEITPPLTEEPPILIPTLETIDPVSLNEDGTPLVDEEGEKLYQKTNEQASHDIYHAGLFPEFVANLFQKKWCGDQPLLRWVLVQFANGFLANPDEGIHLFVDGKSGLGKSEGVKVALGLLPLSYTITGSFSRKGIIYLGALLKPGCVLFFDDHVIDPEEAELFRAIISSWLTGHNYFTVDKMQNKTIPIPQRINRIQTSADGLAEISSDGQDESRYVILEILRTEYDMQQIFTFMQKPKQPVTTREKTIIENIWNFIISTKTEVQIPYIQQIKANGGAIWKLREYKRFLTLIRSIALLRGRTVATVADFSEALQMWTYTLVMISNDTAGLTGTERVVYEAIKENTEKGKRVLLSNLCDTPVILKINQPNIHRALRGRGGTFDAPTGGLLTKIAGLRVIQTYNPDTKRQDREIALFDSGLSHPFNSPYYLDDAYAQT